MKALASKLVNTDPSRFKHKVTGERIANWEAELLFIDDSYRDQFIDAPRPEFANNPNPILEAFRAHYAARTVSLAACARVELVWLLRGMATGQREATLEHEAHARKVLTRIVALEGRHAE